MSSSPEGALAGLKVLDLTRNAPGPFCAMLLADYGADVIQIVDPSYLGSLVATGDPYMDLRGTPHDELSRNKRSIGINLKSSGGQGVLDRLVHDADVLIIEWRPGVAKRLSADYERLSGLNPRLIYCTITGYGQSGPMALAPGHDLGYLARSGVLSLMRDRSGRPIVPPNLIADFGGATLAAFAILAAVAERARTGRGQLVDVSLTGSAHYLATDVAAPAVHGLENPRGGATAVTGALPFYDVYETKDGRHVTVAALEEKFFRRLCERIGCKEFIERQWNREHYGAMRDAFARAFSLRTQGEWLAELGDDDVCVDPVVELVDACRDQGLMATSKDSALIPGAPSLSRTPPTRRSEPVLPCAHTDVILPGLGYGAREIADLKATGAVA